MAKTKSGRETQVQGEINVVPTKEIISKRVYSNFVMVSHGPHDCTLTFCDIQPVHPEQKEVILKTKRLEAPIQSEIVIPHSLIDPLIKAITEGREKARGSKP